MAKGHQKKMLTSVLIVAKQNKAGLKMARKLYRQLKEKIDDIHFDRSTGLKLRKRGISIKRFHGDLIITVGGDGTLLWTAHQTNVPILPVKIEGHGFLCTSTFKELEAHLDKLLRREYEIGERMRLRCSKESKGILARILHKPYPLALNEIVFTRRRPSKILSIEFSIDEVPLEFVGDGLMVSTPAGSTAYNASAGGPIIDPDLDVVSILPLYPFYSVVKPKIIPAGKKIGVFIRSGDCALIIDGHGGDYLKEGSRFVIEKGRPMKIAFFTKENFYLKYRREFLE